MSIIPMKDRILVKLIGEKNRKVGNIVLPDSTGEKYVLGEIVRLGSHVEGNFSVGDIVYCVDFGGVKLMDESEEMLVIQEDNIFAKRGEI